MEPADTKRASALIDELRRIRQMRASDVPTKWWRKAKHRRLSEREADIEAELKRMGVAPQD